MQLRFTNYKLPITNYLLASVGAFASDNRWYRLEQDVEILGQRVVLDVIELKAYALVQGQVAPAADLHGAGHAGTHRQASAVPITVLGHDPCLLGPRPHQAHIALEHVPKLRQFV